MISFPPYDQHFNQPLGRVVYGALANSAFAMETNEQNPGLFQARYDDVATLSLLVTPRLQNYASQGVEYSAVVEDVRVKLGLD